MALLYERVVSLMAKEASTREDRDVELLVPWFQNMSDLFKSQPTDVVQDIVRNCEFLSVPEDTLIIRQGDRGDCFYIILNGVVSIYINQTLEDDDNITTTSIAKTSLERRQKSGTKTSASSRRQQGTPHSRQISPSNDVNNNDLESDVIDNNDTTKEGEKVDRLGTASFEQDQSSRCQSAKSFLSTRSSKHAKHGVAADDNDDCDLESVLSEQSKDCIGLTETEGETYVLNIDDGKVIGDEKRQLGNHIRQLDAGESFGELALVQSDVRRNANVIADTQTDLLVVNRDLYNRSLKAAQQQEFKEKNDFVNSLQLFRTLPPRLKNVMAMSLSPVRFQYGNTMMKQGQPVHRMLFLLSGHAKISMDPIQQIQQYDWLCTEQELQFAKDIRSGLESRLTRPGKVKQTDVRRSAPKTARRRGSYVDAERERNLRLLHVCVIGPNEYIGDLEVLSKLPTYSYSVQCMEPVKALELTLTNFERIISKRSHNTLLTMRQMAETKLRSRMSRLANEQVYCAVMHRILDILEEQNTPQTVKAARRKEEEEATSLALKSPSWHNYRDKQRQFLRKRERERRQRDHQVERMAHVSKLTMQLTRLQNSEAVEFELLRNSEAVDTRQKKRVSRDDASQQEHIDENVMKFVRRLSMDVANTLVPSNGARRRLPSLTVDSLASKWEYK